MADIYKGLTIQFGAETKGLSAALRGINKEANGITSELRKVDRALKFNPGNTELIRQKQQQLSSQIAQTTTKLEALRQAEGKLGKDDFGTPAYNTLQREIIETESKLKRLEGQAKDTERGLRIDGTKVTAGLKKIGTAAATSGAVIAAGLGAAAVGMVSLAKNAEEAQVADKRLGAIAKSMKLWGKEAGTVTKRLSKLADTQEFQLGVDADVIKATQAKLLTFKNLAKSADTMGGSFDRATNASIDLAAAGFGTAESNAVSLGKALQDPIKRLSALERQGVSFTDAEKDKIAALQKSGKLFDAQNIVLAAIEKQVGGTAEATAKASDIMTFAWGAITDEVGERLLPQLRKAADFVAQRVVPAVQGFFDKVDAGKDPLTAFSDQLKQSFDVDASGLIGVMKDVFTELGNVKREAELAGKNIKTAFADPEVKKQLELMRDLLGEVKGGLKNVGEESGLTANLLSGALQLAIAGVNIPLATLNSLGAIGESVLEGLALAAEPIAALFRSNEDAMRESTITAGKFRGALDRLARTSADTIGAFAGLGTAYRAKLLDWFREAINGLIQSLNIVITAYNKLPLKDISTIGRIGYQSSGTSDRIGNVPAFASGGSFAPNSPQIVMVGDQRSVYEHVLREDQIVRLMGRALQQQPAARQGTVINQTFQQPVQSYSETRRAMREVMEELAW